MAWVREGDEGATYPKLMEVATLPGADGRSVNEVEGFFNRCAKESAKHKMDYLVDLGTALLMGNGNGQQLIEFATAVGLMSWVEVDGAKKLKIIDDDPDFIHIRLKADVERERQQNNDCRNPALKGPVIQRDGDNCRWCGRGVYWSGKQSKFKGTLDHLHPGEEGRVDTLVVCCSACNSERQDDELGEWDKHHTLLPVPAHPRYGPWSRKYLAKYGYLTTSAPDASEGPTAASDAPQAGAIAGGVVDPGVLAPDRSGGASAGIPKEVDPAGDDHAVSEGPSTGGPGAARPLGGGGVPVESPEEVDPGSADHAASAGSASSGTLRASSSTGLDSDSTPTAPAISESPGRVGTGRVGSGRVRGGKGRDRPGRSGSGSPPSPPEDVKRRRRKHR